MTDLQLVNLLAMVEEKSRAGAIIWERTAESNTFQTTVAGYVIKSEIQPDPDSPGEPDYGLVVINRDNEPVESIYRWSIKDFPPGFSPHSVLKNIHISARRSAMGADAALQSITEALGKL